MGNNPIWHNDVLGDTIKINSSVLDKNGLKRGEKGFDKNSHLFLFAYDDGKKTVKELTMKQFEKKYRTFGNRILFQINGKEIIRTEALKFLYANKNETLLSKAVNITTIAEVSSFLKEGDKHASAESRLIDPGKVKYDNWSHGKIMDYKKRANFTYTYIKGVGVFKSDFIGNIAYGWAWGGYEENSLITYLSDGDFYQDFNLGRYSYFRTISGTELKVSHVDDVYDSYAIALGWIMRKKYKLNANTGLNNMNKLIPFFAKISKTKEHLFSPNQSQNTYYINDKRYTNTIH